MNFPESSEEETLCIEYFLQFFMVYWKVLLAIIPPANWLNGKVSFVVSLIFIGLLTAVVGDIAVMFGCCIGLKDAVTGITFVALGTSVPDTFASRIAA